MNKRMKCRRKYLILFNSYVFTIKSIYRRKLDEGKYKVFLHFNETLEVYVVDVYNIELLKDFKKGDLVTFHVGNGGYASIEKGDTISKDGKIKTCEI